MSSNKVLNRFGEEIENPRQVAGPMFVDENGKVLYNVGLEFFGPNGCDTRYPVRTVVLPVGSRIARFGDESGRFTAPLGTEYDLLSMPFLEESLEYHEYIVIDELTELLCKVEEGVAAKSCGRTGGGIQFKHLRTILEELALGLLKEDFSWRYKE